MFSILVVVALGQTCANGSCQGPSFIPPPTVMYEAPTRYASQEPRHAIVASGGCSGQAASHPAARRGFRPFGGLFAGRRGGCR